MKANKQLIRAAFVLLSMGFFLSCQNLGEDGQLVIKETVIDPSPSSGTWGFNVTLENLSEIDIEQIVIFVTYNYQGGNKDTDSFSDTVFDMGPGSVVQVPGDGIYYSHTFVNGTESTLTRVKIDQIDVYAGGSSEAAFTEDFVGVPAATIYEN